MRRLLGDLVEGVRLGLLRGVRVLGTGVHLELGQLGTAEAVLGEHAADGLLHRANRVLLEKLGVVDSLQTARVTRVAVGDLLLTLVAGEGDLVGVDDDDEVAGVEVVGEARLVLAAQERGGVRGEAAENDVGGVDDQPFALDLASLGRKVRVTVVLLS